MWRLDMYSIWRPVYMVDDTQSMWCLYVEPQSLINPIDKGSDNLAPRSRIPRLEKVKELQLSIKKLKLDNM